MLRAAELAGIPAVEVRTISNRPGDSDRGLWRIEDALARLGEIVPPLLEELTLVRTLSFGFSPCPNDTFAFHALVHGLVDAPFRVEPVLLDIEELNRRAHTGELDLTKLSFGAFAGVGDRYRLLRSGAALGHGVGPLVVARERAIARFGPPSRSPAARRRRSCSSGSPTPAHGEVVELRYDEILGAVESGEVDAGLIIHESRFTYADHGLVKIADLGEWWEGETGLPVPLAGICARADVDGDRRDRGGDPRIGRVRLRPPGGEPRVRARATRRSSPTRSATSTSRST